MFRVYFLISHRPWPACCSSGCSQSGFCFFKRMEGCTGRAWNQDCRQKNEDFKIVTLSDQDSIGVRLLLVCFVFNKTCFIFQGYGYRDQRTALKKNRLAARASTYQTISSAQELILGIFKFGDREMVLSMKALVPSLNGAHQINKC